LKDCRRFGLATSGRGEWKLEEEEGRKKKMRFRKVIVLISVEHYSIYLSAYQINLFTL
jgi:hypothetical protein